VFVVVVVFLVFVAVVVHLSSMSFLDQVAVAFLTFSQIGALVYAFWADQCSSASRTGTLGDCFVSTLFSWQYFTSAFTIIGFLMGGLFVQLHNSTVVSNCLQADWAENILRVDSTRSARGSVDQLLYRVSSAAQREIRTAFTPKLSRPSMFSEEMNREDAHEGNKAGGNFDEGNDRAVVDVDADAISVCSGGELDDEEKAALPGNSGDGGHDGGRGQQHILRLSTLEHSVESDAWGALYKKVISCLHVWSWRWSPCVVSIIIYLVVNMVKDFTLLTRDFVQFGSVGISNELLRFVFELLLLIAFLTPIVYIDVFYRRLRVLVALHRLEWTENFERLHQGHAAFTLFDYPIRVEFALSGFKVLFFTVFIVIVGLVASEEDGGGRGIPSATTTTAVV
jgi:hypothetical protein